MARPKTGKPPKKNMVLTVDERTRTQLDLLSQHRQQSISGMVADWAEQDVKKLLLEAEFRVLDQKYVDAIKASIRTGKAIEIEQSLKAQELNSFYESLLSKQDEKE